MKVLTVGGAMIDTVAVIDSDRIERMSMLNADSSFLLLEEGRKIEAQDISTHNGGGGINAAVALARLGLDVAAMAKLGRDARAETILAGLMQEGVSTRFMLRDSRAPTGASVIVSSHDRNAAVFTFRGANTLLETAGPARRRLRRRPRLCRQSQQQVGRLLSDHRQEGQGSRRAGRHQSRRAPALGARRRVLRHAAADRHPVDQPVRSGRAGAEPGRARRRRRPGAATRARRGAAGARRARPHQRRIRR